MKQTTLTFLPIFYLFLLVSTGCDLSVKYSQVPFDGAGVPAGRTKKVYGPEVILMQDFENNETGIYSEENFAADWGEEVHPIGIDDNLVSIVRDGNPSLNKIMAVHFPEGSYASSGDGKTQFKIDLGDSYESLYCSYNVKFSNSFDFVKGGKLPGLAGGECNAGGNKPDGYDGFSTRAMWRSGGNLVSYIYHPDQPSDYGEDFSWGRVKAGIWYHVEMYISMNTPGEQNGILEAWINGIKVLEEHNLRYRNTYNLGIDTFYFSTFFGGSNWSWAASKDEYIYFDNLIVSTHGITH